MKTHLKRWTKVNRIHKSTHTQDVFPFLCRNIWSLLIRATSFHVHSIPKQSKSLYNTPNQMCSLWHSGLQYFHDNFIVLVRLFSNGTVPFVTYHWMLMTLKRTNFWALYAQNFVSSNSTFASTFLFQAKFYLAKIFLIKDFKNTKTMCFSANFAFQTRCGQRVGQAVMAKRVTGRFESF